MSNAREKDDLQFTEGETLPTVSFPSLVEGKGGQVGHYKLLGILGEGGFAIVYLAEQNHPVRRRVALKVIKPGMDTKQVIARFEAERQALALLDHPNITQVYDAGTTETGRPYFVMEHIKGVPITQHCDQQRLSLEERLRLFLQVCDGVQHAHQKGIIHRDIKPANVLVLFGGEKAVPKIIDFGVAKALIQPLTERTLFTEQGQLIGTPEYMSPEQAAVTAQEIDARSDVYSLGVLLYEQLVGARPFDRKTLELAGFAEIRRIIREEDPPHPSTLLSSLGEGAEKVAASRSTEVATLAKRLRKELEWIPLKAMRKERSYRYQSVPELADDIRNYLNGRPLIAGPPGTLYRMQKYIRKHRSAGIVACLILVIITNSSFICLHSYGKIRHMRESARKILEGRKGGDLCIFFTFYHSGEIARATEKVHTDFTEQSRERTGALFLLDPRPLPEKQAAFREELLPDQVFFFWLIVGELHLKNQDGQAAISAYKRCVQTFRKLHESDYWIKLWAEERLEKLSGNNVSSEGILGTNGG